MTDFLIEHHNGFDVLREDVLPGGSKSRFVPQLLAGIKEAVYAGPYCGGGAWALAVSAPSVGCRATLFYAKRKEMHRRQLLALKAGATIYQVPHGYLSNVTAKARAYCAQTGAVLMPIGFDCREAISAYTAEMLRFRQQYGTPAEIWCATGSGLLARCLGLAFPEARVCGVVVGLASKNGAQEFTPNVLLRDATARYDFAKQCKYPAPFPCDGNYDRKAWELLNQEHPGGAGAGGRILFWNVAG